MSKKILRAFTVSISVSIVISTILFSLLPLSFGIKAGGIYNPVSQLMWCADENACIHELMHYMDDQLDWPSQDIEFLKAIDVLKHNSEIITMNFRVQSATNVEREFYARLFAYYYIFHDEVPDELVSFYDWNIVDGFNIEPGIYWLIGDNKYKIISYK